MEIAANSVSFDEGKFLIVKLVKTAQHQRTKDQYILQTILKEAKAIDQVVLVRNISLRHSSFGYPQLNVMRFMI